MFLRTFSCLVRDGVWMLQIVRLDPLCIIINDESCISSPKGMTHGYLGNN